ncbi:MAG: hypothetical protein LV473_19915 [Nitrospira sp.]|nr:hypothetical protein [Nitrospira sp.]
MIAPTVNLESDHPFVQRISGRTTTHLRKSWLTKVDGTDNFPLKNDRDLFNHAQDAALIAACPPHTWRETIFRHRASRPRWDGNVIEQDGLAVPELAPDWAEYMERRTWPLVKVLGSYPISWKRTFADQKFYQNPQQLDDKRLVQNVPSENQEGAPPGSRHMKVEKQPGGRLARVRPDDGPARKIQLKGASEAVVFWLYKDESLKNLKWSIRYPAIFSKFSVPRHDPGIPQDAKVLATWYRHTVIHLDEQTRYEPGFYRVIKLQKTGVTLIPENSMTRDLEDRLKLGKATSEDEIDAKRVSLGKSDLIKYFQVNSWRYYGTETSR